MSLPPTAATRAFRPPSLGDVVRLAWPIVVSRSCQTVISFLDAVMLVRLGENSLAAGSTGSLNALAVFILPMGAVQIVNSFSAQFLGEGNPAGSRRYGWYGLLFAALVQAFAVATIPFVGAALGVFDFSPAVHDEMARYVSIRILSAGAVTGMEGLAAYWGGLGNTRLPMIANFAAMALNVPFNWILIFGKFGFPAFGVRGAALASLAATTLAFGGLFALFLAKVGVPSGGEVRPLQAREFLRMLRFGIPNGVNWFVEFSAFLFFINFVIGGHGTTALAAMNASLQIMSFAFMPAFGIATSGSIFVGQAIGARRPDAVPGIVGRTFLLNGTWTGFVGALYVTIPRTLFSVFDNPSLGGSELIAVGAPMLMLAGAWQLFDAAGITLSEALRAAGDTLFCLWARLLFAWLLFVPLTVIWARVLGGGPIESVGGIVVYLAALAAAFYWRFRRGAWQSIDLTGRGQPV